MEYIVEAIKLQKIYTSRQVAALRGVSLYIRNGEVTAIMGPSGCGKTTLLYCLSGLERVTSGIVKIAGLDLGQQSDADRTRFRALHMGFVFQNYNLLPVLSGLENVELPLLISGLRPQQARRQAMEAIEQVGLTAWVRHKPAELSGGQQQRFAVARALATRPTIVWADEPTGALDSATSQEIIDLMLRLNREHQLTFVWVTHSSEVAAQAQHLITMRDGSIVTDHVVVSPSSQPERTDLTL